MKTKRVTKIMALRIMAVSFVALTFSLGMMVSVSASDKRNGHLHVTKDCAPYNSLPGGHCTIASSNLLEIPAGSNVYYDQAPVSQPACWTVTSSSMPATVIGHWAVAHSISPPLSDCARFPTGPDASRGSLLESMSPIIQSGSKSIRNDRRIGSKCIGSPSLTSSYRSSRILLVMSSGLQNGDSIADADASGIDDLPKSNGAYHI